MIYEDDDAARENIYCSATEYEKIPVFPIDKRNNLMYNNIVFLGFVSTNLVKAKSSVL